MRNVRRRKNSFTEPAIESLEDRRLLTAEIVGKTLLITGTEGRDTILVTKENQRFVVVENGQEPQLFGPLGPLGLTRIEINGLGGADHLQTKGVTVVSVINGGDGDDYIKAGKSANLLRGNAGDDTIIGSGLRDIISGGSGNDFIRGQADGDVIGGGNGNDTILGTSGADQIDGGNGNDSILAGAGADHVFGGIGNDTIDGSHGSDSLRGGGGRDVIKGKSGADTLLGGGGADELDGGDGTDLLIGAGGRDLLLGGNGRDLLTGGENRDTLMGGNDDDILIAGTEFLGAAELTQVAAEWNSDNDYDQRVANIRKGSGQQNSRLNGDQYLIGRNRNSFTTVFNDLGSIDQLMGEDGEDWFFVSENMGDDDTHDRGFGERREVI
ncbi:MAG: calcium-binding protein [Planctomycetaceae bacterium]